MATGVSSWSTTASSNATADSNVGWAEGMAPSAVNDSARAMMASVAMYRDDLAGITTGGTSTAYTVTTNQGFASLAALDGNIITIIPNATSGATPTLAVDGLTAKSLRLISGENPPVGAFVAGTPYTVYYDNSNNQFLVIAATGTVPVGSIMDFAGSSAPGGWLLCYGQAVSRTTYAALFAVLGTTFGTGDGSTTFNLPDLRGRVVAGEDDMGGSSAGRLTSTYFGANADNLGATGGSESHTLTTAQLSSHTHTQTAQQPTFTYSTSLVTGGGATTFVAGIAASGLPSSITTTADASPGSTAAAGSGSAHNNVQPTIILNKIIRAL